MCTYILYVCLVVTYLASHTDLVMQQNSMLQVYYIHSLGWQGLGMAWYMALISFAQHKRKVIRFHISSTVNYRNNIVMSI